MTGKDLENLCLDWLRDKDWDVLYGPDISPGGAHPERKSYNDIILVGRLEAAIKRLNTHLPAECIGEVVNKVIKPESLDLLTNNRAFHRMLLEGVPVSYKAPVQTLDGEWIDAVQEDRAFLIDFERVEFNDFIAVNQYTLIGIKQPRIHSMGWKMLNCEDKKNVQHRTLNIEW